ncbi:MAG TPA: S41 family peptidase [Caldilineaceae bacterium]|nr:S41 family peptidase [Caldilineaceae bacterium]
MTSGYYRFPTLHQDTIVFVSEDDLWSVPVQGGVARRLTSNLGETSYPALSPDGSQLAFVGREEGGPEVYVMAAAGGSARRLTYLNSNCRVVGWTRDGGAILFASNYGQVASAEMALFQVRVEQTNGEVEQLPYGAARSISFGPQGGVIIGRNTGDPARWKRYRGGTTGHLWIDVNGDGEFHRFLPDLAGNIASPMWLADAAHPAGRIYFVSDHEGIGNLYSARPDGSDLRRHTDHEDYYVRNPNSDGVNIVYHAGADLYLYRPAEDTTARVEVLYHSPRVQRNRKFVDAGRYMDAYSLHPSGQALAMTTRGKAFGFFNHEGPVVQYGKRHGVRYRQPTWLHDWRRLLLVSDEPGEERLEIYSEQPYIEPERLDGLDIGRVVAIKASPVADLVALSNHRHELLLVDLKRRQISVVDRSPYRNIAGFDWSPDGRWLAYSFAATSRTSEIRLYHLPDEGQAEQPERAADPVSANGTPGEPAPLTSLGTRHTVTQPVLHDVRPAFDPDGKYLYFLSYREFNPVYDGLHFDLGFPWGMRPYLVTLRADLPNPFVPTPELGDEGGYSQDDDGAQDEEEADEGSEGEAEEDGAEDEDEWDEGEEAEDGLAGDEDGEDDDPPLSHSQAQAEGASKARSQRAGGKRNGEGDERKPQPLQIDLEGIERRVLAFPVPDGRYGQIAGIPNKALFTVFPIQGQLDGDDNEDEQESGSGTLRAYDFKEYKCETLAENVSTFDLSANRKKLLYSSRNQLRVINAGEKAPSSGGFNRKSGWIDLGRVKVSVDPQSEWEQMFREAWRLQRDHFWTPDMAEVDWQAVYHRYYQLIPRVSTRGEFSDLMWEMQGELGTSHAYEFGGDYRPRPHYGQGFLGADLRWDEEAGGYRVGELILGDPWDADSNSPLAAPGVDIRPGDVIVAINGQPLNREVGPAQMLVNQAGHEVLLTLLPRADEQAQVALPSALPLRDGEKEGDQDGAAPGEDSKADQAATQGAAGDGALRADGQSPEAPVAVIGGGAKGEPGRNGARKGEPRLRYRSVSVRAIADESQARYRRWVEANRRRVHEASDGRIGYVHVPDMGAYGYAEFHRGYLAEVDRDALIVDVRYNGGGHVSQLILEKLARRRLGYDLSRWGGLIPYPVESVAGPLIALTNEHAGSDGDIFCHSFKMMKLGPLIGKRTWGGVIGISPRHALVDGTVTTQPEYSFWFEDVGWNVENYGTDPDIEVDITPQDYREGRDPQLETAIAEGLRLLEATPKKMPELTAKPSRALPKLPPRTPVS